MEGNANSEDVKTRMKALREDRSIKSRMRTYLRRLLVTELRGLPRMRLPEALSVRARALAYLLVEWLQSYNCHYSLSVLVSELPGLADLPRFAGRGDVGKFQINEVEEILSALDIKSDEIIDNYSASTDCLLTCLLKVSSEWKSRLEFRELNLGLYNDKRSRGSKLKKILTAASIKTEKLESLFGALNQLIDTEVEETIEEERKSLQNLLIEREKMVKENFRVQEERIKKQLLGMEEILKKNENKAEEEFIKKRGLLDKIEAEVQRQHDIVVENLKVLEVKAKEFETEKKAFEDKFRKQEPSASPVKIVQVLEPTDLSSSSSSEDSGELVTAWRRIKQLREETQNTRQECAELRECSEQSSSAEMCPLKIPATYETFQTNFTSFRQRFGYLLTETDGTASESVARKKLLQKSSELSQLINAVRCPSRESSPRSMHEIRDSFNQKKLDILMKCVRSREEPLVFPIHSPIKGSPDGSAAILPPLPTVHEILQVHQPTIMTNLPMGVTQLALADVSDVSEGEITAGRVSQTSPYFSP